MAKKKPADKGNRKRASSPASGDPDSADIAFADIIDAILSADPEAVREHQEERRRKRRAKPKA